MKRPSPNALVGYREAYDGEPALGYVLRALLDSLIVLYIGIMLSRNTIPEKQVHPDTSFKASQNKLS